MATPALGPTDVTVILTTRECPSQGPRALRRLLETIPEDTALIWVATALPLALAQEIKALLESRKQTLFLDFPELRTPNQCRNAGIERVTTRAVLLSDQENWYEPGWFEALLACANQTGAAAISALPLMNWKFRAHPLEWDEKDDEGLFVHMTGGHISIDKKRPQKLIEVHDNYDAPFEQIQHLLRRQKSGLIEFHCALIRRFVFEKIGYLDEEQITKGHSDLSLQMKAAGLSIWFEPDARFHYSAPRRIPWIDMPFYLFVWSEAMNRRGLRKFYRRWALDTPPLPFPWLKKHRLHAFGPVLRWIAKSCGRPSAYLLEWLLERLAGAYGRWQAFRWRQRFGY